MHVAAVIAPASRLGDNCRINLVAACVPNLSGTVGSQYTAVEEKLLHSIGEQKTVLGVGRELLVNTRRLVVAADASTVDIDDLATDPLTAQFYPAIDEQHQVYLTFEVFF